MSAQEQTVTSVALACPSNSVRLRKWAARRTRQLLRVLSALTFALGVGAIAVFMWRAACLVGLPDIGDPFDAATMRPGDLRAEQDAFAILRQASAKLRPWPDLPRAVLSAGPAVGWSKAVPKLREWVEANREALALFKRAAEQADGWAHPMGTETAFSYERADISRFVWLALMEGSRLEERGDTEGAWAYYRAIIRMRVHIMRRGTMHERLIASLNSTGLRPRVALWAANPHTRVSDLRRALDNAIESEPMPGWDSTSLKIDYALAMRELDRTDGVIALLHDEDRAYRIGGERLPPNLLQTVAAIRRFLMNEPERSRRVLRLATANWLAHVEIPEEQQRKPAVRASFLSDGDKSGIVFFPVGPAAPASARRLRAEVVAQWLVSAPHAKWLLSQWPWPSIGVRERSEHHELVILLAEELYRREHGRLPTSEQDLVGRYLKKLPDDGTRDLDDGTALRVEDPRLSVAEDRSK